MIKPKQAVTLYTINNHKGHCLMEDIIDYWLQIPKCDKFTMIVFVFNPLNAELNPICLLLALFGAHHVLHVSS